MNFDQEENSEKLVNHLVKKISKNHNVSRGNVSKHAMDNVVNQHLHGIMAAANCMNGRCDANNLIGGQEVLDYVKKNYPNELNLTRDCLNKIQNSATAKEVSDILDKADSPVEPAYQAAAKAMASVQMRIAAKEAVK